MGNGGEGLGGVLAEARGPGLAKPGRHVLYWVVGSHRKWLQAVVQEVISE